MAYDQQEWADGEAGGTPITADALNHIEAGLADAASAADAAQNTANGKADPEDIPDVSGFATTSDLTALAARVQALEDAAAEA